MRYRVRRPRNEEEHRMKPESLLYTKEHLWVELSGGEARFGITDHAQQELEDIVFVDLPEKGKKVATGDIVCTVESVKSTNDLPCPFPGEVVKVNAKLQDSPETINKDPLGEGWLFVLRVEEPVDRSRLLDHAAYEKLVASEGR
jgi:glycine cleavage system H protein